MAANLGAVGLGTDTGNSIRGPSSHTALVGIRSTIGVTSRDGIVPLYLRNDIGGPMARTVEDAVRIFSIIAGYDPADPVTESSRGQIAENYLQYLDPEGLKGARLGVLRAVSNTETADPEMVALFDRAIEDLKGLGAEVVDPLEISGFDEYRESLWCDVFQYDVDAYFASLGANAPVSSLEEVFQLGNYSEYIEDRLKTALAGTIPPEERDPPCLDVGSDPRRVAYREAVIRAMDANRVDAIIYPSWSNPARLIGDLESPHGNNSPYIAPHTGQPALTVPMGFTGQGLPGGLQMLGRPFREQDLIRFAYAYEQATRHRRPPSAFPELE